MWPLPVLGGSPGPELTATAPEGCTSVGGAGFVGKCCHFHDSQLIELEFVKSVPFVGFYTERRHNGRSQRSSRAQPGCNSTRGMPEGQLPGADLEPYTLSLAVSRDHTGLQAASRAPAPPHGHRGPHLRSPFLPEVTCPPGCGGLQSQREGRTLCPGSHLVTLPIELCVSNFKINSVFTR